MRTITVAGGHSGSAEVDLTDRLETLDDVTIRTALVAEGGSAPATSAPAWKVPGSTGGKKRRLIEAIIDETVAPGRYNLAVQVVQDGRYETVWVLDQTRRNRRAIVEVI